ncbi:MAG: hypothetical protein CHACPFDD_00042 [Phycisphaerae bacterium]|nr:hypothetical protein [Phycisphaerae bacterium]
MTRLNRLMLGAVAIAALAAPARAQLHQVNGAGATLFVDFFRQPAATNDFIDCDGDGTFGPIDTDSDGTPDDADQLANPDYPKLSGDTWWIFQYRSVGSIEGYNEFVDYQLCGNLPESIPSERGLINTNDFAVTGVVTWVAPPPSCTDDTDGDGTPNGSGTPVCPETIDFANTDVETAWATQSGGGSGDDGAWDRKPRIAGYGLNAAVSNGTASQSGQDNLLASLSRNCPCVPCDTNCDGSINGFDVDPFVALLTGGGSPCSPCAGDVNGDGSVNGFDIDGLVGALTGSFDCDTSTLNTNVGSPNSRTVFDTYFAFSPVAILSNRGVNYTSLTYSNMQHLWVTGRGETGENLAVAARDVGSGTRNAHDNSLGIDPSWGVGDHVGKRINSTTLTNLGVGHQVSNCGGSSVMENAVQQRRLAIGYTGLVGSSRAVEDARAGRYEIVDVVKNVDCDGDGTIDGASAVRPKLTTVVHNSDPDTGYQIGGVQTIATVGNPNANRDPGDPLHQTGPLVDNEHAAALINNIISSLHNFEDNPSLATSDKMPAELFAKTFFATTGVDGLPDSDEPCSYLPNADVDGSVQAFILANNVLATNDTPNFGSIVPAGKVPVRNPNPDFNGDGTIDGYNDGSLSGSSYEYWEGATKRTINGGQNLSNRNRCQGDFNADGARSTADIPKLMSAVKLCTDGIDDNENLYVDASYTAGSVGNQTVDVIVLWVMGDLNGDGNFDAEDVRYFADGCALVSGALNRKTGFTDVDTNWAAIAGGDINYFNTTLATPKAYVAGDARGDVAGNTYVTRGASPTGWDGKVDADDIDYVCAQIEAGDLNSDGTADWADLDEAVQFDLSADMNGDLKVNAADLTELVVTILGTQFGDVNLDGAVNAADCAIATANNGLTPAGWADGDVNCDGIVNAADRAIIAANGGISCP